MGAQIEVIEEVETSQVPLEYLEREICQLASNIAAATCRWLLLLAEFAGRFPPEEGAMFIEALNAARAALVAEPEKEDSAGDDSAESRTSPADQSDADDSAESQTAPAGASLIRGSHSG